MSSELKVLRTEKKYRLSIVEAELLFYKLAKVLEGDPFHGNDAYMVRSLYFDTLKNDDYWEKMDGLSKRKKIRLRIYNPDGNVAKLEIKEKQGNTQLKRSLTIDRHEAEALINGDYDVLKNNESSVADEFYQLMKTRLYRPVCIVEYQRKAFASFTNDIRITFDSCVSSNEGNFDIFDKNMFTYSVMPLDSVILEVKYNGFLLSYIKELINSCDCMEQSNSKYCMARTFGLG